MKRSTGVSPVSLLTGNVSVPDTAPYHVDGAVPAWLWYETVTVDVEGCESVTGKNTVTWLLALATIDVEPIDTERFEGIVAAMGDVGSPKTNRAMTTAIIVTRPRDRHP
jgi:hypothetical protein